jgi:hypothetical protein
MDQEFIMAPGVMDQSQTAMNQFGPGGTYRAQGWGGVPFEQ